MKFLKSSFFFLFTSLLASHAATITWNGLGDGSSFNNPANWIGNAVPGASDNAVITSGAGTGVIVTATTTVLSVQCSKAFTVSSGVVFTVTAGSSQITGAFSLAGGNLAASGAGTTFTANGSASVDDDNFIVSAGAVVTLPNLFNYAKNCAGANWTVTGAGSVLNLPGLTNITGQACAFPTIQAEAGGQLLAPKLATITGGPLAFNADGANSLINFSGLTNCTSLTAYMITFEASAGGTIQMPLMPGGPLVGVTINAGGSIPTAQLKQLISLTVSGSTNSFPALTNMDGGAFSIMNGASVTLPVLRSFTTTCSGGDNWTVTGANSVLNLPGLTNITGQTCSIATIQAAAGGVLILTNVATILTGALNFQADGVNSLIDLSALASVPISSAMTFEASAGGTIRMPLMAGNSFISMTINAGGTISTAQLKQLNQLTTFVPSSFNALTNLNNLTANGATNSFPALANMDDGNFSVLNGASVTMPTLRNYAKNCAGANWTVTGAGSVLNLPGLTNITGQACAFPTIQAEAGGQLLAPKLATITGGPLAFNADGANSLINFSGLTNCTSLTAYMITFEASAGGTIQMPLMPGGPLVGVTINAGGSIPTAQLKQLISLTVSGSTNSFPALTNMDGGAFSIMNGASVTLPVLRSYTTTCSGGDNWTVTGANSVLNLPGLTNITGQTCSIATIQAAAGGVLILTNVATILTGALNFQADGVNSLIDLSALASVPISSAMTFEASAGGTIRMPLMAGNSFISMTINAGGTISTAQLKQLNQLTTFVPSSFNALTNLNNLTANGATNSFQGLNNFDDGNFVVNNGAVVTLPNLFNYNKNCSGAYWTVMGANSVLNLPVLTNITGQACAFPAIQAEAGGAIFLTNVATIVAGPLAFQADGTSSLIDLSALISVTAGQNSYEVTFEASAGGTVKFSKFNGDPFVGVTLNPGGNLSLAQLRQLYSITVNNGAVANFAALTNLDGGSLSAESGGKIMLPLLQKFNPIPQCNNSTWEANGVGSQIIAPALTVFVGPGCAVGNIQALAGGQITLSNLNSLGGFQIAVLADGAGSVVDLSHMSSFISTNGGNSTLRAQNNGVILLRTQSLLLQNIAITTSPGNPALPPYTNSGPNLTLYGIPWHSYLVQQMDTTVPGALWQLFQYVPLTNAFQEISAAPPANFAFRATDFVADPPLLTLAPVPDVDVQMVLYGATNKTYEIQSATNLTKTTLWTSNAVAVMTNAFRIYPPVVADKPKTFFRAKQIAP